jgi:hypothetical protein|tara:strand:+ start:835 stop:1002 length:168 start_codon:yes stop_codon:yes gene_type:complete
MAGMHRLIRLRFEINSINSRLSTSEILADNVYQQILARMKATASMLTLLAETLLN